MRSVPSRFSESSHARGMYAADAPPVRVVVDRTAELRRDQRLVPARPQRPAEVLLAQRAAVDVGGVEQCDAGVEGGVYDRFARGLIDAPTEVVASESDNGRLHCTDRSCLHPPSMARDSRPGPHVMARGQGRASPSKWAIATVRAVA